MIFSKIEKELLLHLFKSTEGLYLFTLYKRLGVSPSQIFKIIENLTKNNSIVVNGDKVSLSQEAREFMIKNNFIVKSKLNKYSNIPNYFLGNSIGKDEIYLPQNMGELR
jgi:predicted transcriptional regulator